MVHFLTLTLLLVLSACNHSGGGAAVAAAELQAADAQNEAFKVEVLNLINAYRDSKGVVRLIRTGAIEDQIQTHTQDMTEGRVSFGHKGMSARCEHSRVDLGGGNACGEIVAWRQNSPQNVFDTWIGSTKHRERIAEGRYNRAGVGLAVDADGNSYWGVLFLEK